MATLDARAVAERLAGLGHNLTPDKQAYKYSELAGNHVELVHPTRVDLTTGQRMTALVQADQIETFLENGFELPPKPEPAPAPVEDEGEPELDEDEGAEPPVPAGATTSEEPPPADNDHVAEGAEPFAEEPEAEPEPRLVTRPPGRPRG